MVNYDYAIRALVSGAVAGLAVDLSLYPLDTIKTRLQSKEGFKASGGFKNIYRGMSSIVLGSAPGSALFFITYNSSKQFINRHTPLSDALCASVGEVMACLVRVPTELVKQRAQTSNSPINILNIGKKIYKQEKLSGLYRGFISTVFREIPFSFIEFPLWEFLKRHIAKYKKVQNCTPLESGLCGSVAGLFAAGLTTPLDVIKTRTMLNRSNVKIHFLSQINQIVKTEGFNKLYSGIVPRSLWMGAGGFIFFFAYEFTFKNTLFIKF